MRIEELIDDMRCTMIANRGIGIAANQVGSTLRIFVIDRSLIQEKYGLKEFSYIT